MLLVLLVNHERLLEQSVLDGDLRDLGGVVVLQLVDIPNDLAFVCTNGSKKEEVLKIANIAEGGRFDDDFLK